MDREFIFDEGLSCHASTLAIAGDTVIAAWFAGTREGASDVNIWSATRDGQGWSSRREIATAEVACWNPVLHATESDLLLFFKAGTSPRSWSGFLSRSTDGRTWSEPEILPAGILGPIKNKPFLLDDGTLVCGSSVESYRAWSCWVERTRDLKTWTKHGPIGRGIIQPAIFGTSDHLAMLCRGRRTMRSESFDGGITWSDPAPVELPNPNSGLDAVRLDDGRILCVYNHSEKQRTPLNVAVSEDFGVTWRPHETLEDEPGEYSYPAVIEAQGAVHITYTWRRQRIAYRRFAKE